MALPEAIMTCRNQVASRKHAATSYSLVFWFEKPERHGYT
jgi:hypothetical protein